jgi:hypothetical protein
VDPVADQVAEMAVASLSKDGGGGATGDGPTAALAR